MSSSVIPATTPVSWTAVPNGSAATPSFAFQNSSSTGIYRVAADSLGISTAGVQRVVVDASGNVGIGTAVAPGTQLGTIQTSYGLVGGRYQINLVANAYYNDGYKFYDNGVATLYSQNPSDAIGGHTWKTAAAGTAGNPTNFVERMRIDANGNLLVNKTAVDLTTSGMSFTTGASGLRIVSGATTGASDAFEAYSSGASAYRFYVTFAGQIFATSTSITGISDERLKENIRDLDEGLNIVLALKPRKFDWKEGKGAGIKNARGFIAQEFEQVLPDMIEEWKDPAPEGEEPYKAVNANLIPTLVKAIQEQQAIIDALEARLAALESK